MVCLALADPARAGVVLGKLHAAGSASISKPAQTTADNVVPNVREGQAAPVESVLAPLGKLFAAVFALTPHKTPNIVALAAMLVLLDSFVREAPASLSARPLKRCAADNV